MNGQDLIDRLEVSVYRIPTDRPEADGTFHWESTTMVLVEAVSTSGIAGLGYTYTSGAAAEVVRELLVPVVVGNPVLDVGRAWEGMIRSVRNVGLPGIAACAISAVDVALWDLKAKTAALPLCQLLGGRREAAPVYGSGGFTSYRECELIEQLGGWAEQGIQRVKMKIGKDFGRAEWEDLARVQAVRYHLGEAIELMVDANGAYHAQQAVRVAKRLAEYEVTYFEEPVAFDYLDLLTYVREHSPVAVASGEYAYSLKDIVELLAHKSVDILQADATRLLGITGTMKAADLAYSYGIPFSLHTAPAIHAHVACAAPQIEHVEYFHDHVRIENMLFDGVLQPKNGCLYPDKDRPGLGLDLRKADAEQWRVQ